MLPWVLAGCSKADRRPQKAQARFCGCRFLKLIVLQHPRVRAHNLRIVSMTLSRRSFLGWLAAAVPASAIVRSAHAMALRDLAAVPPVLHALAEAVLPSELGASGIAAAVTDFQRWMAEYREGRELVHGYGTSLLERTGPTPATRWMRQLDALDTEARRSGARSFASLSIAKRQEIVRAALADAKATRLTAVVSAAHVASAILSHFYAGSTANDLCYQAHIGRQQCRPLAQSSRKPLPLAGRQIRR
jgi:hypothetical protein